MVVAQKVKEAEITEQDSLLLTRNLLRIAIFNISYIRGLFPEKYFSDKSVPALEMKIKKLMPMDAESRRLIDWMEKGVYDALQKKYLKTLLFCVCEALEGPMIEEYAFSFGYSNSDGQEVSMNINRTGTRKGGAFKCNSSAEVTPNQMRSAACKMVRTLVQLMRTLDKMPEERTILMKLLYYDDVTPVDYEPPFFRGCSEEEAQNPWIKSPLKMEVGNVNSKHYVLSLKVKSVLDPCEDDQDNSQDDEVSLGADSVQRDEYSESDSEENHSPAGPYVVAPIDKGQVDADDMVNNEDDNGTQDPEEDEQQLNRVKNWIDFHHLSSIALTDVLSNFPDITVALIEEIMRKLVEEGVLVNTGNDIYTLKNHKVSNFDFPEVKEENDGLPLGGKGPTINDFMYMKALYHALPMRYVTVAKLQEKFNGEANQNTVRKLIDRMINEGMVEAKGNRRLGKRIIHSDLTEKMLNEAKKVVENEMDIDATDRHSALHQPHQKKGSNHQDLSTCGALHSVGSDLTRMRVISDTNQNTSMQSEQIVSRLKENERTPISNAKPAASRESFIPGNQFVDEVENVICSRSTQDKRARKTSMVKEPILQLYQRQKSQAP